MQKTVICFDYGIKFTGVAIGQTVTKTANPLGVIIGLSYSHVWKKLQKIFFNWKPHIIVVGLPLNMDGSCQNMTKKCELFATELAKYFKLPIEFQDERLTTYEAKNFFYKSLYHPIATGLLLQGIITPKKIYRGKLYDALSASIILEDWLNKTV